MRKSIKESPNFTEHKQEERDKKREPHKEERFLRGPWEESFPPTATSIPTPSVLKERPWAKQVVKSKAETPFQTSQTNK